MKLIISLVLVLSLSLDLHGQEFITFNGEKINQIDSINQKQGVWKLFEIDKGLVVECTYWNDSIIGDIDIFKNDKLNIKIFDPNSENKKFIAFYESDTIRGVFKRHENTTQLLDDKGIEFKEEIKAWLLENTEVMPIYYGGQEKLIEDFDLAFNQENTKGKRGRVIVSYILDEKGCLVSSEVISKSKKRLSIEALRIFNQLPRWQPAFQGGRFVKVRMELPMNFYK